MMRILLIAAMLMLVSGCGDEPAPSEPADGKVRPPPSGEKITEAAACNAFSDAHSKALLALSCVGTARTCPTLLRLQSGANCLQYDKGSLDGCVTHINEQTTCADLGDAVNDCIVYSYADSAPAGCP